MKDTLFRDLLESVQEGAGIMKSEGATRFFVPGAPVPKQSFRYSRTGGYTDPRVTAWQSTIAYHAEKEGVTLTSKPVKVGLLFLLKTKRRVDCDNLSKAVLDALNGVAWADDKQVVDLHIRKSLTLATPGVWIEIEEEE